MLYCTWEWKRRLIGPLSPVVLSQAMSYTLCEAAKNGTRCFGQAHSNSVQAELAGLFLALLIGPRKNRRYALSFVGSAKTALWMTTVNGCDSWAGGVWSSVNTRLRTLITIQCRSWLKNHSLLYWGFNISNSSERRLLASPPLYKAVGWVNMAQILVAATW